VSYEVRITGKVEKAIAKLPSDAFDRMNEAIDALGDDPRPPGCKKLGGRAGYRIRVGEWRAIYRVNDQERTVDVVQVAHRRDIYRRRASSVLPSHGGTRQSAVYGPIRQDCAELPRIYISRSSENNPSETV
jgi:mRNA interferase RelE/StbE